MNCEAEAFLRNLVFMEHSARRACQRMIRWYRVLNDEDRLEVNRVLDLDLQDYVDVVDWFLNREEEEEK